MDTQAAARESQRRAPTLSPTPQRAASMASATALPSSCQAAERLTDAINDAIAKRAANPFGHMVRPRHAARAV